MGEVGDFDLTVNERFDIRRKIARGSMGSVYQAYDRERRAMVAIKTLPYTSAATLYRFKREFRALADIEHPNLVSLGELIEYRGRWFFTMDYVSGVDFLAYVRGRSASDDDDSGVRQLREVTGRVASAQDPPGAIACDEARLRRALGQLARAIAALHRAGKVHRDIKPSNILVTADDRVVLLDFGLVADIEDERSSGDGNVVGTVAYMAPEQADGIAVGPAADWYSFGVVLYEALTGRLPHEAPTQVAVLMNKQQYEPPAPRALVADVPRDLDRLCADLLVREPSRRLSADAVLARLGIAPEAPDALPRGSQSIEPPPFVGREAELKQLRAAFARVDDSGAPAVVVVEGESGVGKTALLGELVDRVRADDPEIVILRGRCYEREAVPYKAVDGVIDALAHYLRGLSRTQASELLPVDAGLLARVFPILDRVEALALAPRPTRDVQEPQERRRRAFSALRELLLRLTERRSVVVTIDDLQWADRDSALLLDDLLRPPGAPPLLLLVSQRPQAEAERLVSLESLAEAGAFVQTIELGPLDRAAAEELARRLLEQRGAAADVAITIAEEAAGHPLYIGELAHHAATTESSGARPRLDDAIRARVEALPGDTRAVLELVAIAGIPLAPSIVAAAARMAPADVDRQLSVLRVSRLVKTRGGRWSDQVECYHDRVRDAVVAVVGADQARDAHQRLALVLDGTPGVPAEQVLQQFEAAGLHDKAAGCAEEAADWAARGLAFDRAAELYRAALRLGSPVGEERRRLQLALGQALVNAGRGLEAAGVYLEIASGSPDPALRMACRRQAADQLIITGHLDRGVGALRDLLGEIGAAMPATPRRALLSLLWQRFRLRLRGISFEAQHESEIADSELTRIDVLRAAGHGLATIDNIRGSAFNARYLRRALAAGEPSRLISALGAESSYLSSQGGRAMARARRFMDAARSIELPEDPAYRRAWIDASEGIADYFAGRFGSAAALLASSQVSFRETAGSIGDLNNVRMFLMLSLQLGGELGRLRELHDATVRDAARRADRYMETTARRLGVVLHLAADDPARAEASLSAASWVPPAGRFHVQHWLELVARGELALYQRRAGAATEELEPSLRALDRSLLPRIQILRAITRYLEGRLLVAAADPSRRVRRLCRKLEGEGMAYATVFAGLVGAAAAHRGGDDEAAAEQLRRAIEHADPEMHLHAAVARYRLGELSGDAALIAGSVAAMQQRGIARPDRFAAVLAPGWSSG